jgi:stearoyl-CoA desaturase (delta-9 desaturase)
VTNHSATKRILKQLFNYGRHDLEKEIVEPKVHWAASLVRWFDSYAVKSETDTSSPQKRVDWLRVIPFIIMHLVCVAVIGVGWSWVAVGVAVAAYVVRMFAITGFYHRYFSHRTYKTSRLAQFVFALVGNSAVQRGPLWWAAHHRQHHRYSDQFEDPHSPEQHGFIWSHMLWVTSRDNFATGLKEVKDLSKYPELVFLDRFDTLIPIILGGAMFGLGAVLEAYAPGLGTNGLQMLIWGFFISTVVLFHGTCTINSLSHLFGSRRFATTESSRNNPLLAFITFGEGWHNNHHHYPGAVRQGFYWWEFDFTYYGLKVMSWLGIIWGLNAVPERVYQQTKSAAES